MINLESKIPIEPLKRAEDVDYSAVKIDSPTLRALDEYFKEWGPRDKTLVRGSF